MEAPPALGKSKTSLPVLGAGLVTTALALLGVWAANQASDDFNIMGWYGFYIIPAGALLVGLVAGSGYGIASWLTGVRISRNLLLAVLLIQVAAYFVAQYIEFRHLVATYGGEDTGFFEYFDLATRSFAFKGKDGSPGDAMGGWGYIFRLLEIAGFAFGGIIAPLILRSKPYCETCQIYMRTKNLGLLPAGIIPQKIKKKDMEGQAGFKQEHEAAWEKGMLALEELRRAATEGKTSRFNEILKAYQHNQKEIGKLTTRIAVSLSSCPSCHAGLLNAAQLSGQGDKIVREDLGSSEVNPGLAREVRQ
jgi:hypothetical protein